MNSDRRDGRPCKTMSDSVTSFQPSPTPFPSGSLPSLTSTPVFANSIATDPSSLSNDDDQIEQGPPIAAVAGAGAAAMILIIAVAIWYIIRRRRRQQQQQQFKSNAVSPSSSSSKPRVQHNHNLDLEKQLDFTTPPSTATNDDPSRLPTILNDTNNKQQTSSPVLYSSFTSNNHNNSQEDSTVRAKKKASQQSMRQQSLVIDMEASTPPVPPRRESMHYQPEAALELQKQLGTTSTAVPPSIPASSPSGDLHIDMVSLDLEKLMPIVISEELQLPGEARRAAPTTPTTTNTTPPVAPPQIPIDPSTPVPRPQPVHFATEVIPSTLRRPSMMSRKSTDSVRSRIGSTCHPPPPPPPSIPLPALPMAYPGGVDVRGGRSTASSSNRGSTPSRRSISLESATRWAREVGSDSNNTSARNSQESFLKGSSTPSSPPSSVASSSPAFQQHARMPSRSGTQFFASPEQVPTSPPPQHRRPISPPVAPLTVQIPRTSSRSIHTYFGGPQQQPTFTAPAQPESPTIGSFETSSVVSPTSSIIAELLPSIASRTSSLRPSYLGFNGGYLTPSQRSRSRSISQPSSEIHRVALPGATADTSSLSPPSMSSMPSILGDHLPPPPPSHSFLLRRYPTLLQHRPSSGSVSSMDQDDYDDVLDPSRRKRRSMSVDSTGMWTSSQRGGGEGGSSCSVSPVPGGQDHHAEDSDPLARQDQEVQAIIADAIAIAQAKSAAVQAARQSTWYRQYQQQQQMMMQMQQQQQQQQLQKTVVAGAGAGGGDGNMKGDPANTSPWTLSESHFTEEKTTVSACTSGSSSSFYSSLG
ncbi:hypothetical protein BG006_007650 [Podila minutissima]|uniref:Uncharacterized protein n=1 Tax=Podila minutissima TaxID=64525 RepID=A0A9P5SJW1_9FUNG|nr:hypothetical protein BG006_007650 [Podila minutissima]